MVSFIYGRVGALCGAVACIVLAATQPSVGQTAQQKDAEAAKLAALVKAAQAEKKLMSYGSAPILQIGAVYKAFEKKYGISIDSYQVTGSPLTTRFSSEAAAGAMQADVLAFSDTSLQVEHPEYFQKFTDDNFPGYSRIPEPGRLPSGLSISYQVAAFGVFWNTNKMTDASRPQTWQDLGDPKWKGQAVLIDPRASATYRSALNVIRKMYPGLLEKIAATEPRLAESGVPAAQLLAAGTGTFAFPGYADNAQGLIDKGAPVAAKPLNSPQLARRNWISATAGPHPNAGRLYVHYLTMEDGLNEYCKLNKNAQAIMDMGKAGCQPLSPDAQFLTDAPISDQESDIVVKALHLN